MERCVREGTGRVRDERLRENRSMMYFQNHPRLRSSRRSIRKILWGVERRKEKLIEGPACSISKHLHQGGSGFRIKD